MISVTENHNPYGEIVDRWIVKAFRPATRRQHLYVVRLFVGLAEKLSMDPYHPTHDLITSFIVFLSQNYRTQKIVRSMLSTAKACIRRAGIDIIAFDNPRVSLLLRSVDMNMRKPTRQRPPVDSRVLKLIMRYWRQHETHGEVLAVAALTMFVTGMRQSNLFPVSQYTFDPTRQLTWDDVVWRSSYLKIRIKWGKAQQKTSTRYQRIPRADDSSMCVLTALKAMYRLSTKSPRSPLFAFPRGRPIPLSYINKKWRCALKELGLHQTGLTLHSLRRGGARYLQDMGVGMQSIASHVGWKSAAILDYVNPPGQSKTVSALKLLS